MQSSRTNGQHPEWLLRLKDFDMDITFECDGPHWHPKAQEAFRFMRRWLRQRFPELGPAEQVHKEVD